MTIANTVRSLLRHKSLLSFFMLWGIALPQMAMAHFIWLVPQHDSDKTIVNVYFAEEASSDDPELLKRLDGMTLEQLTGGTEPASLPLTLTKESLTGTVSAPAPDSLFIAKHDLGVLNRGDAVFRLKYYAKTGPAIGHSAWTDSDTARLLPLDVVPTIEGNVVHVQVRFNGELVKGTEVKASGPGMDDFEGATDETGHASFTMAMPGLYSIRARQIDATPGELDGKKYETVRHYSTVAVDLTGETTAAKSTSIAPLPEMVTSFGGAVLDGQLYVFGGHTGGAHSYSLKEQGHLLRRVSLSGGEWETVCEGPHLQGLALVAHGKTLYRIGGFTAKNAAGEKHDLWSQDGVAAIDPVEGKWIDLPALPESRSSHDAAVLGDTIYVVGGWSMGGEKESNWHTTAWSMDVTAEKPEWKALPQPPFTRRALSVAAHDGKIYAIGGMQHEGGPTTRVDVFNPQTGEWSQGPSLVGEDGMTGFGNSSFATGGRLYVSTIKGDLQRLSEDGSAWEIILQTPTARFFHRMLPVDDQRLLMVGGANMKTGKFDAVDMLNVE
ncbi:MAG: kelch repeat-containing protein [Planctomycetaceae bacterium]